MKIRGLLDSSLADPEVFKSMKGECYEQQQQEQQQ